MTSLREQLTAILPADRVQSTLELANRMFQQGPGYSISKFLDNVKGLYNAN